MNDLFLNIETPKLTKGNVYIWAVHFDRFYEYIPYFISLLEPGERLRMDRKRQDIDKQRYAVSHGMLRLLLGKCIGLGPDAFLYQYGPYGKPVIHPDNVTASPYDVEHIEFNMSDSGNVLLITVTNDAPVGVDVEKHREIDIQRFSRRFFTSNEADNIERLPEGDRIRTFFKTWTCKEAYVKGWGYGITANVGKMEVYVEPSQQATLMKCSFDPDAPKYWDLLDIPQLTGYSATVAIRHKNANINFEWI